VIVLLAFTAEAAIGFGATVITVTLAVLLIPMQVILPAFVPINLVLSAYLVVRHARAIAWRVLLIEIAPAVVVGLAAGIVVFRSQRIDVLALGFALFMVALSAAELWRARREASVAPPLGRIARTLLLGVGGFVHGCFGSGGPMIVYVLQRRGLDKSAFRVTLALVWLCLNLALVGNYATLGLVGRTSAALSLLLGLALAPGLLLGEYLHRRLSPRRFQIGIFSLLLAAGLALAVRTALELAATTPRPA
jgi:uncharacterized membrane protein YfcA